MILGELVALIGQKVGKTDATTLALLKKFTDARHKMICGTALWKDLLSLYTVSVSAGQAEVMLPHQVERFLAAKYDTTRLLPVDQQFVFQADPGLWDRTGSAGRVAQLPSVAVGVAPTSEKLSLVSSNAADTAKTVTVVGELAGVEKREVVTLNGTTAVQTTNSFDKVYTLAKQATAGTVTVTGYTSAATLVTLASDENQRTHVRLRLLETPTAAISMLVLGKRRVPALTQDSDHPAIRGVDQALEAFVLADAYEWMRQGDDASAKTQEAVALLAELRKTEVWQETTAQVLMPYDGVGDQRDDWGGNGFSGKTSW